ncbi:DNA repair protein RadC [Massilia sp. CMS3.1]|uniref:RadC family protein n=1 Tax=Massilia sp. CMS3.1 TaxID=3373083 RepID=UPI003EE5FF12
MNEIKRMSRAELACELITMPEASIVADAIVFYAAGAVTASPSCEEQVSRKLSVARELLMRDLAATMRRGSVMRSPDTVREWLKLYCAQLEHEVFLLLHLDVRNRLIAAEEIFRGTLTHTSVYPREVVKSALARNAASVLLAHNHPSGETDPSPADQVLTRQLASALAMVDVRVADHFVVAGDRILSFAEQGLL